MAAARITPDEDHSPNCLRSCGTIRRSRPAELLLLWFLCLAGVFVAPGVQAAEPGDPFAMLVAKRDGVGIGLYRTDGQSAGTTKILNFSTNTSELDLFRISFHVLKQSGALVLDRQVGLRQAGVYLVDAVGAPRRITFDRTLRFATSVKPVRVVDGRLFFLVDNAFLYHTDGTDRGTHRTVSPAIVRFVDVFPFEDRYILMTNESDGKSSPTRGRLYSLDIDSRRLELFYAFPSDRGWILELDEIGWRSNEPGSPSAVVGVDGDRFVFTRSGGATRGLWVSDGTAAGTHKLLAGTVVPENTEKFIPFGPRALFIGDSIKGDELWTTDGTPAGTRRLRDIWVGNESSEIDPEKIVFHADKAYFLARTAPYDRGLWVTDGTSAATKPVRTEVNGLRIRMLPYYRTEPSSELALIGNEIFFAGTLMEGSCTPTSIDACRFTTGLYSYNVVTQITSKRATASRYRCLLADGREVIGGSYGDLRAIGSKLLFSSTGFGASDPSIACDPGSNANAEPWVFDTLTNRARLLKEINPGRESSDPYLLGGRQ
ncbi:hypothetical protein [Methylobrevis albus]|uniref:ELWxxDGT repeat-containing protein n=1 Tax=Methylobrevis albus TaxID=2793297 RepID=A0A931MZB0_9HYPH|nr:hypothetical protein [Methylobrevis albus]MBH0239287.1 hypothetical protein [Methylobrevis albus]